MIKKFQSAQQFSCNVYVISSDRGTILIDPGYYGKDIRNHLKKTGGVDAVLLTHGHWDHTYGLDDLNMDYPDTPIFIHEKDRNFLQNPVLNGSAYNGFALIIRSDTAAVPEGKLGTGGYDIDVIHAPGHTGGSVLYYFRHENVLFTGDAIMKDVSSPTFAQTGSAKESQESMRKFIHYGFQEDTAVYPGHGESTTYGYLLEHNPDIKGVMKCKK